MKDCGPCFVCSGVRRTQDTILAFVVVFAFLFAVSEVRGCL